MKTALLASWLVLLGVGLPGWGWLTRVREHNLAQAQGLAAARRGQPTEAVLHLERAVALAGHAGPSPELLLNLAQAQTLAGQLAAARGTYAQLLGATVPPAIASAARQQLAGSLAAQGQLPPAIGLLRQALRLDPTNAVARYNYEVLSEYLAGQPADAPPAPGAAPSPAQPRPPSPAPRDSTTQNQRPDAAKNPPAPPKSGKKSGSKSGSKPTPRLGQSPPGAPLVPSTNSPATKQPQPAGSPQPGTGTSPATSGAAAPPRLEPGAGGPARPTPTGSAPGPTRGLDPGGRGAAGRPSGPGTEAATATDRDLQTQRERLRAMNLSPAQAQQLLDALRASEQQYLQQRPLPHTGVAPAPGQPTW